jgi:hypothetical protein
MDDRYMYMKSLKGDEEVHIKIIQSRELSYKRYNYKTI